MTNNTDKKLFMKCGYCKQLLSKKGIMQHISRAHKNKHSKLQRTINKMITEGKTE